jgi:tRNA pseudouridine38-40 synthase
MISIEIKEFTRPPLGTGIEITYHANAFCRHMCRILTGTLAEVGMGKRKPEDIAHVLHSRKRASAGITAPSCGLTLLEVIYAAEEKTP